MPIHIGELRAEVTVADGDLPLSPAQIERLVALVAARIERARDDERRAARDQAVRHSAIPGGRP